VTPRCLTVLRSTSKPAGTPSRRRYAPCMLVSAKIGRSSGHLARISATSHRHCLRSNLISIAAVRRAKLSHRTAGVKVRARLIASYFRRRLFQTLKPRPPTAKPANKILLGSGTAAGPTTI
jgi:hypothetical protein